MFRPWLRQASTSSPAPLSPLQSPKETPLSSSMLPGIELFLKLSFNFPSKNHNSKWMLKENPRCGHCQKLAPAWEELAKAFEKDEQVTDMLKGYQYSTFSIPGENCQGRLHPAPGCLSGARGQGLSHSRVLQVLSNRLLNTNM